MTLLSLIEVLQLGVFVAVAAVSVKQWRRHRGDAAGWVATTLLVLLGLAAAGHVIQPGDSGAAVGVARRVVVALLAIFPFSLYRFTASFSPDGRTTRRLALAASAVMAAAAFVLPAVSPPPGPWPWWLTLYGLGMVVQWTLLSVASALALWSAGRRQPLVARRRMQLLGAAALVLNLALLILVGSGGQRQGAPVRWQQGAGLVSGILLLIGFAPPAALRIVWRRVEMEAFRAAEADLVGADTVERVASVILPHAIELVGARAGVLVDAAGTVQSRQGVDEAGATAIARRLPDPAGARGEPVILADLVAVPVHAGWLAVVTSPATPVFGREEIGLLGTLAHLAGLALDRIELFDRERASREALAEREFQLAEAQRTAQIGSYTWNPEAGQVSWSDEMHRVLGYDPGQVDDHGAAFAACIHPDDRDRVLAQWSASRETAASSSIEYRIVRPDGDVRWIHGRVQPASDAKGADRRLVGTLQDVTDQKLAEARLREAVEREQHMVAELRELARVKTDFISTISHELRTPLTSIAGYIELLADGDVGPLTRSQLDVLDVVDRNARRLTGLIENLLTLSRSDSGDFTMTPAPLDVLALVQGVHRAVLPSAFAQGLQLTLDVEGELGTLVGDAAQLDRVLLNLLSNAIKFTPAGGHVTLRVQREGRSVRFSVTDTGIGIPLDEQEQLFSRFFRSSNATELAIQGTGLGLAIVKTIVEEHGGTISIVSRPGVGTTVAVALPVAADLPGSASVHAPV